MARTWTADQQAAMNIRDKTVLVSAAAGSGKTATLTERIIRRITDASCPADISKMLIVTFTRAAAAELKTRIFSALSDALSADPNSKHLAEQLMKIGSANISTIDSFYFDIVQSNASALGLPCNLKIADDAEYALISSKAMENTITKLYEENEDFPSFIECFAGVRQSNALADIFLDIHENLNSIPEGIEFLRMCAERTKAEKDLDFFSTEYGKILKSETKAFINHYYPLLISAVEFINADENVKKKYGEPFEIDLDICRQLYCAIDDSSCGYKRIRDILLSYTPMSLKGRALNAKYATDESRTYKAKRAEFIDTVASLSSKAFSKTPETISRAMEDTSRHILTLYKLLSEFEAAVSEEKLRSGILTFADIRRHTLSLLVNPDGSFTDIAKEYSKRFTDIYIDEYQDVDRVQDLIFRSISKPNNRFMVGDIKQSIYEFRGADPSLFAEYKSSFPLYSTEDAKLSDTASVFMSENFRCDQSIIDFTNMVCSEIFSAIADSIGYVPEDDLIFSKIIEDKSYVSPAVSLTVIKSPSAAERKQNEEISSLSNKEIEAEYIAEEISRLIRTEKKANGSPIFPGDIAVLFRSKAISPYIAEALKRRGILSTQEDAKKYFESPDVLLMLCVLNTVNNPQRDTYLAGTLRSALFGFTMEDLIKLRISADPAQSLFEALRAYAEKEDDLAKKCKEFTETLEIWQYDSETMPIDKFLRLLFDSKRFMATGIVSQPKSTGEGGNLLLLYEYARAFESGSFKGLYQFIEHINSMIREEKTFAATETAILNDRVSLMTIHKSKGLEFPVCFLCDANHSIISHESKESFVMDKHNGVALKISDESGMARINTPMREAILSKLSSNQTEEEMRILYVALTRARERLYVTAASSKEPSKFLDAAKLHSKYFDRYTATALCSSYLEWILAACHNNNGGSFNLNFVSFEDIKLETVADVSHAKDTDDIDENLFTKLTNSFKFEYQYNDLSKVPSKLSVSRLYPDVLDKNDNSLELFTETKKSEIPDFFLDQTKKVSSAERGTATHLFLQFCNFEYMHNYGVIEELSRLQSKRFLPKNASDLIYTDEIDRFIDSDLMRSILSCKKVIREQRFNVKLSPADFTKDEGLLNMLGEEHLAVQGVIDLILVDQDGNIELYDYKTDRLSSAELSDDNAAQAKINDRHGLQLSYYAKAAELLFGRPCKRVAVYSTHSAKLYDIDVQEIVSSTGLFRSSDS